MTRIQHEMAKRIREHLERLGWSQADLAREVGVSQKHLTQLLNGKVEGTLSMWQDIFDALHVRVDIKAIRKPKVEI